MPEEAWRPFWVARLLNRRGDGTLHVQWLDNKKQHILGTYELAWFEPGAKRLSFSTEALKNRAYPKDVAYTNAHTETPLVDKDVGCHGFQLTNTNHLPQHILVQISEDDQVDWSMD